MLSTLVAAVRAKSAALIRFLQDDENELEIDDDDGENDDLVLKNRFGLAPPPLAAPNTNINHVVPAVPRFTRSNVPRTLHN